MDHLERLLEHGIEAEPDTIISLPVARDHGFYAGILYPYLLEKKREHSTYPDSYNKRQGVKWIVSLPMAEIVHALPIFPDTKTVKRAADALENAGMIKTESTGAFLDPKHVTGRKRDTATWWHVPTSVVPAYVDQDQHYEISALETIRYGSAQALILAHWRHAPNELKENAASYKKLSAAEMAKILPLDERTNRRNLKEMLASNLLIQHPEKPKLYTLPTNSRR